MATKVDVSSKRQIKSFRGHRIVVSSDGEKVLIRDYKNPLKATWAPAVFQRFWEIRKELIFVTRILQTLTLK